MTARHLLACLFAAALVVGACGGDDDEDSSPVTVDPDEETTTSTEATTTTSESTTTTPTPDDPIQAVEQAFFAQWDAYLEVAANPDPDDPLLAEHFTGGALEGVQEGMQNLLQQNKIIVRPEDDSRFVPRIIEIQPFGNGDQMIVFECTLQGLVVKDSQTGEVLDDGVSSFGRKRVFAEEGGVWKVAVSQQLEAGDPPCDAV